MDFPLILVSLVFLGSIIWLLDVVLLAPRRRDAVAKLKLKFPGWAEEASGDETKFLEAQQVAAKEPLPVEYAKSFLPVIVVVLVLRSFIVEPFQIPSSSMVPSLEVGDFILVNKFTYGIRLPVLRTKIIEINKPARGDVMVFFPPNDPRYFIKRIVGLPGDNVQYDNSNKVLTINGEQVRQKLLAQLPVANPNHEIFAESLGQEAHQIRKQLRRLGAPVNRDMKDLIKGGITVPEGHYLMMGDNRDNSSDSRVFGFVAQEKIVGKAFAVWMHWDEFWSMPSFNRMGTIK